MKNHCMLYLLQRNSNISFDDLKFSYTQVQGSDSCDRLRARRLYLPRKGTCGEEGRVQQQPCPEYPLLVQLCADMEAYIIYWLFIGCQGGSE